MTEYCSVQQGDPRSMIERQSAPFLGIGDTSRMPLDIPIAHNTQSETLPSSFVLLQKRPVHGAGRIAESGDMA